MTSPIPTENEESNVSNVIWFPPDDASTTAQPATVPHAAVAAANVTVDELEVAPPDADENAIGRRA